MKQLSFTILFACITTVKIFSQTSTELAIKPAGKDSAILNKKFYFPVLYYTDSAALYKAMPKLAEQLLVVYTDADKRTYFENTIYYYLLAGNYKKATDLIDSVRNMDADNSYGIEIKSYALAKINEKKQEGSFEKVFKKEFSNAFDRLSFRKKVYNALFDTTWYKTSYTDLKEKLQKENKDSLSLEDTRSLCDKFCYYSVYKIIHPLMLAMIDPQYRETFPAIKGNKWGGVVPVQGIDEIADPNMKYKLLMELTGFAYKDQDSAAKKDINAGLGSVARQINLHEAAGIPRKNIDVVIVVHGSAIDAFLNNEKYKKKYKVNNPNLELIKELQLYGVKIIACGQLMTFANLEREDLVPGIKEALTAQTVISSYQLKGYVHYDLSLTQ